MLLLCEDSDAHEAEGDKLTVESEHNDALTLMGHFVIAAGSDCIVWQGKQAVVC